MDKQAKPVSLFAAGEICINRDNPESILEQIVGPFSGADIKFFQLETVYSERGAPSAQPINLRAHPRNVAALKAVGFNVASFASNHTMDWSHDGLFDTIDVLNNAGIRVVGVGRNLDEARAPAILERSGARVAFLGYNSNLPQEYWATDHRPGCAPLRAFTVYEPQVAIHPGSPPYVHTFSNRDDLKQMCQDIKKAKAQADVVAVSMHWGIHAPPHALADYQIEAGHAAIDAGADIILGTGPHQIKPIEVYKGKVIFYSLGNFAFDFGRKTGIDMEKMVANWEKVKAGLGWDMEPEWIDNFMFAPRGRKGVVGKCIIREERVDKVSFLPVVINKFAQPRLVSGGEQEFEELSRYVDELCKAAELDTRFHKEEDEVVINLG